MLTKIPHKRCNVRLRDESSRINGHKLAYFIIIFLNSRVLLKQTRATRILGTSLPVMLEIAISERFKINTALLPQS